VGEQDFSAMVSSSESGAFTVDLADISHQVKIRVMKEGVATLLIDGYRTLLGYQVGNQATVHVCSDAFDFALINKDLIPPETEEEALGGRVVAPMHGQLVSLLVEPNQSVEKDQRLGVFEAMKMQHEILASVSGVVQELNAQVGQQLAAGDTILVIDELSGD
jgi:biotin carboxyl carrier protein